MKNSNFHSNIFSHATDHEMSSFASPPVRALQHHHLRQNFLRKIPDRRCRRHRPRAVNSRDLLPATRSFLRNFRNNSTYESWTKFALPVRFACLRRRIRAL